MNAYIETTLEDFKDIFQLSPFFLSTYIFRGQINESWQLSTSLERVVLNYSSIRRSDLEFGYEFEEKWMLHEFKKNIIYILQISLNKVTILNGYQ